jgi:hypothetical protein
MEYAATAPTMGGYPIQVTVTGEREINRLWGIPIVNVFVREILAIPHFVVAIILAIGVAIWFVVGWIWILIFGNVPGFAVPLLTEFLRRAAKITGYVQFMMPGGYPPLEPGSGPPISVDVNLMDLSINRLWGIPLIGFFVRYVVLIPHLIVLAILGVVAAVLVVVTWIVILVTGQYPEWAASYFGKYSGYTYRVMAYFLFLPVPYPPFTFS